VLEVLLDDLVDVRLVDVRVPDLLGVHDDDRPFVAAVEAAGLVDPHLPFAGEAERLHAVLRVAAQRVGLVVLAAVLARLALVAAEEDVVLVIAHWMRGLGETCRTRDSTGVPPC
jgi:hypothetical protein